MGDAAGFEEVDPLLLRAVAQCFSDHGGEFGRVLRSRSSAVAKRGIVLDLELELGPVSLAVGGMTLVVVPHVVGEGGFTEGVSQASATRHRSSIA